MGSLALDNNGVDLGRGLGTVGVLALDDLLDDLFLDDLFLSRSYLLSDLFYTI